MAIGIFERLIKYGKESLIKCESPFPYSNNDPYAVIKYNTGKSFETVGSTSNEWWQISVDKYFISPESYRIMTFHFSPNNSHPKSWNLSASSNNITWTIIDSQNNRDDMNVANTNFQFTIKNFETFFKYFRITLLESHGTAYGFTKRLSFREFDIYGVIQANIYATKCAKTKKNIVFVCFMILLSSR